MIEKPEKERENPSEVQAEESQIGGENLGSGSTSHDAEVDLESAQSAVLIRSTSASDESNSSDKEDGKYEKFLVLICYVVLVLKKGISKSKRHIQPKNLCRANYNRSSVFQSMVTCNFATFCLPLINCAKA